MTFGLFSTPACVCGTHCVALPRFPSTRYLLCRLFAASYDAEATEAVVESFELGEAPAKRKG